MKNRLIKPLFGILAILAIAPLVGLFYSVHYRNLDAFYLVLFSFSIPLLVVAIVMAAFAKILVFFQKRSRHQKNKNSN